MWETSQQIFIESGINLNCISIQADKILPSFWSDFAFRIGLYSASSEKIYTFMMNSCKMKNEKSFSDKNYLL